jgi:hypothetical protein
MRQIRFHATLLAALVSVAAATAVRAAWVPDGTPLSVAASNQQDPMIVPDDAGGAIVVWRDFRNGATSDVYAQRVDATGTPQWTANGTAICVEANNQEWPAIVSDGAGGAIIAWQDARFFWDHIYVQRVDASGVPQWGTNGVILCAAAYSQTLPIIASDGAGGAIVAWRDYRSGTNYDIYVQRVNAAGAPQWTADGIPICTASGDQLTTTPTHSPSIVSDGAAGAIVTWFDYRSAALHSNIYDADIYAQRVNASGALQWTTDGVEVCTAAGDQAYPAIVTDGAGGAILTWWDKRSGDTDVYAQRLSALGAPQWTDQGAVVCSAANDQFFNSMIPDGSGGAMIAWNDRRAQPNQANIFDVYAQRVSASGIAQWTADGVAITVAANSQINPQLVSDDNGGAIVTWYDNRSGTNNDIYAQRVDANGASQWTADGVAVCLAVKNQFSPTIVSDGSGGAIVAWYDRRSGTNDDIYVQHLNAAGNAITTAVPASGTPALFVGQLYPNPFSTSATLDIEAPAASKVAINIYDVAGRAVRTIQAPDTGAGLRSVLLDGRDAQGRLLANGVYFCRVRANGASITRKIVIAR